MKKIFRNIFFILFSWFLVSCNQYSSTGKWENVIKDKNGATTVTTVTLNETFDSFTGTMVSVKTIDNKTEEKKINISGYVSGRILVIELVNSSFDPYFRRSTLTLSTDGTSLVLAPGGQVFNKK